jgi:uncharacterized protein YndB with AHSA1/START domain
MTQTVKIDIFYPYPPEKVWKVLTNRRALAAWLMENDFEPRLGHKFQFYGDSLPGLRTRIQCEVIELDEPQRLAYTWQERPTAEPSLVIWTLIAVDGGTQLQLKHLETCYAAAIATSPKAPIAIPKRVTEQGSSRLHPQAMMLNSYGYPLYRTTDIQPPILIATPQLFEWDYYLNQKLLEVLQQEQLEA